MRGSENICFVGVHIFKVAVRFPWSASSNRRYLCSVTIGALASGILLFSERPGVWRKCNVKFFCEVRSSAGQWKKKPTDRQRRPGHRTRTSTKCQVFPAKPEKDQPSLPGYANPSTFYRSIHGYRSRPFGSIAFPLSSSGRDKPFSMRRHCW